MSTKGISAFALALVAAAAGLLVYGNVRLDRPPGLLNVSYDPTREVYAEIDAKFAPRFRAATGEAITINQSHGGSSRQAAAVQEGMAADVVTLGLPLDIERLRRVGLIADGWRASFPNDAEPYFSTIVFVVRQGNPRNIRDWGDLAQPGLEVVTPSPKSSANGKLSFLAAWGSVLFRGGTEAQALELVSRIYRNISPMGSGARDSTNTFELAGEGDVQLTWENEAIRETRASKGALEIIYPPVSIRAEPCIAIVAANAAKHHLERAAQAYLEYLYSNEAQEIFARQGYRPSNQATLASHRDLLPNITLFPVTAVARDWDDAQAKFFAQGGIFDSVRPDLAAKD